MKRIKNHHLLISFFLLSFLLFSSAICNDDDDASDILVNEKECLSKTFEKKESIDKTNLDHRQNFAAGKDDELGDLFVYTVDLENVCVDHSVNIVGAIYCNGDFCTGGFEWGVFMIVNDNETILDPVNFDCYGGICEFDFTVPADYTNLFDTYKFSVSLIAIGDPGNMKPMNYFAWKIDRFEIEINYHATE